MKRFALILLVLMLTRLATIAQTPNLWLDSTQINQSKEPLYIVNGIIVKPSEINIDFITSMNISRDKQVNKWLGRLADNGCVYVEADQQFDVITPRMYQSKKKLPTSIRTIFFMLNGNMVSDTLRISKASIHKVDVLVGSNRSGLKSDMGCLSIWTLTDEERGIPKQKGVIRIHGAHNQKIGK